MCLSLYATSFICAIWSCPTGLREGWWNTNHGFLSPALLVQMYTQIATSAPTANRNFMCYLGPEF